MHQPLRILIASRRTPLRSALKTLLQTRPGIEIVAMAKNNEELLHLFEETMPDLLLLDEDLNEVVVDSVVRPMKEFDPNLLILILGQRTEIKDAYLEAGAIAYVTKDASPKSLLTAIEEARLQKRHV